MSQISCVAHDVRFNTLEVTWVEVTDQAVVPVRCHNYSAEQKDQFLEDTGPDGEKYVLMAGW